MTSDSRDWVPPGFGGDNRLTGAEVRRALFRTKDGFFLLFGLLFGGIPTVIAVVFGTIAVREARLEESGRHATATVVGKRVISGKNSSTYRIDYEYAGPDGHAYPGSYSTSHADYASRRNGDPVDVAFAPDEPSRSIALGHRSVPIQWVLPFLGVFVAVGGVFLAIGGRGLNRRLRLYGKGIEVWGKSLGVREDPSMRVNNRPCKVLEFEYVDLSGQTHVCRSAYLDEKTIRRLEGLETVPVVYVPDRPDDADLNLDQLP
jgi:hypothetical protein